MDLELTERQAAIAIRINRTQKIERKRSRFLGTLHCLWLPLANCPQLTTEEACCNSSK